MTNADGEDGDALTPSERTENALQTEDSLVRELLGQCDPRTKTVIENVVHRLASDPQFAITVRYATESSESELVLVTEGIDEIDALRMLSDDDRSPLDRVARFAPDQGPVSAYYVVRTAPDQPSSAHNP